ncbi:MAG: DUF2344 domain-containing protein [Clostridiaceae bacterium]|nr:TIGR03936 family radical SAM-associated protein [Oscillospiraceae bacterium]NLO61865.1 DUF2344 domain-containing protein [Clostridiaceae bacterium]
MLQAERERQMTMQKKNEEFPIRMGFERKGSIIYIGHLDLMRTFERTLRRAELPVAYSLGYNPRPTLIFALPLGVGIAASEDVADIFFSEKLDPSEVTARFNAKAPPGLRAVFAREIPESGKSVMSLVTAASYRITAPDLKSALDELMLRDEILVTKKAKGKATITDIRPLVLSVTESDESENSVDLLVYAGSSRNLRPDLLLSACVETGKIDERAALNAEVLRTGLYTGQYPDLRRLS